MKTNNYPLSLGFFLCINLIVGLGNSAFAQTGFWIKQTISTATDNNRSLYAADLDNDGDLDVLSASSQDNKIAWYENDGAGNFGAQQIISTAASAAWSVYAADLDGDGDIDVLSASQLDNKIAWYSNDGLGNFGPQQIISTAAYSATSVYAADLDNDGDIDVLSASRGDDKIAWYENDGAGNFGAQQIISTNADGVTSVYVSDLDNDGDLDVLSASWNDDKIAWYRNDGLGNFGIQQIISTNANNAYSVYAVDLDNDGDIDALSASWNDDKIAWYENDGTGNFGAQQIISTTANAASSVYAADLDNDGDIDVLSAALSANQVLWYQNDGAGNFGAPLIIGNSNTTSWPIYAADLDNDGDIDVLSASAGNSGIFWYENLGFSETDPLPPIADFTTLPTPDAAQPDTLFICQGQTVQFFNQSQNANAFLWEFGNEATSTTANPAYTYPDAGTYEVTLNAYSNFPQPFVCEADAGEWVWGNVVGYTENPDYENIVVVSYENIVQQIFMMPLSVDDQQTIFNYYYQGYIDGAFFSVYSISFKPEEGNPVIDFFNISSCMDIDTLTFCGYLEKNVTTYFDEITGVYNTEIEVCKFPPVITYIRLTASNDSGVVVTDYGIYDNDCFAITIPNTQPGEIYELLIHECFNYTCTEFFPSFFCDTFITIPDTSPRPVQKEGEDNASLIIVVESGFAPQINCVATVCEGTIADYSTGADCETYEWAVTGGQILSGQGTPSLTVEWTNPSLGSISLSADCGVETCNQPTVAAVPIIGNTVVIEGQTNFCLNEVLQYTAPYFGGTQYFWSIMPPSAGTILSGQGSNLITVQWGGTSATLQLTYENNLLDCGGTASFPAQIRAAYSIEPVAAVCQGHTVVISANSLFPFVWSVSGGEIVSGQNTSEITLLCTVPGNIIVSAVPVSPDVFCNFNAQTNFAVVPYPEIPVSISGNTQVCPLQTYTYTTSPPLPNTMFVWTANGGNITAGQNSPTIQVQWDPSGSPYSLSVVRETLTSPVCTSLPVELSVSSITDSPFTITGASSACPNSQKTYQITPVLSDASYIWSATPPDAALLVQGQNTGTATFAFGNTASGIVTLSATYCNLTAQLPVSIGSNPMPVITQTDTLCTGSSAQLVVSDLIGVEPYTLYQWQNSAGAVVGTNPNINISTEDVYTVQVTNASGCTGISTHRAYQYTSPMAQISGGTTSICIQSPTDIGMLAIDGTHYSFQWMLNSTPIVGANTPFLTHFGNDVEGVYSYRALVTDTQSTCSKLSNTKTIAHILCTGGGGGTPGDTILPPPPSQCPPFAGNSLNFTLSADTENCGTVNLTLNATGSFLSYLVQWGDGIQESYSSLTTATHTYPQGQLTQYTIVVSGYYIHPVTGNFCSMIYVKNHILPMVSRFDIEPACVGEAWVFQCRSYYHPSFVVTERTWDFGDGTPPIVGNPTEPHIYTAPGTYTISLSITNGICTTISSKILTVPPLPNSGFTISGGECVGSPVLFTPNQTNHSAYYWQFGNGATAAQTTPIFTYTQAGTYQVSLQVLGSNGCLSGIQTQSLTIIEAPEQQPVTATDTVFCAGNSTLLTAPSGGISYLWSNGQTSPEIMVSTSGNYSVQVTLPDGCLFTSPPVTIQAIPNPVADISPASPVNYCEGDSVTLQIPLNANYTYQWSENDNGQHFNTFTDPSTPSVTVTDTQTGCTAIGTATLVEQALPTVPQIAASALDICEGTVVNINITSSTNALNTYYWTNGVTGTGITVATSGQYGVWVQNQYGCQSDTSTLLNIVVNPLPDAGVFPAGCYSICEGEAIFLPPNTAQNYQWYYNGNLIPDVSGSSWIPQAEGAYWVVLGNGNCIITSDVLQLEFSTNCPEPLPVSLINFTGTVQPHANLLQWTTSAEVNNAYFTLQYSPDGNEFTTLAQITGAGTTSTAKSYQHTHSNPFSLTYYRLLQTDYDGTTRQAGEVITLSRTQPAVGFTLTHILPNPTRNTATLTYTTPQSQPTTLHLYDLTGRLLFKETLHPSIGTNNYVLDMLPFPNGLYVVTLNNGVEVVSGKVMKE